MKKRVQPIRITAPSDSDELVIDKVNIMLKMYEVQGFRAEFKSVDKGSLRPFKLLHKERSSYAISKEDKRLFGRVIPIRHFKTAQALATFVQDKILNRVQLMRAEENA